jgi:hypothetical protein
MSRSTRFFFGPLAFLLCMLLIPDLAAAQTDFSGTWAYNQSKSDQPGGGGGGRMIGGGTSDMVITQDGNTITIKTTRVGRDGTEQEQITTYIVDGEPHEVSSGRGTSTVTATWKDGTLVATSTRSTQRGEFTITTTYSLQADGKELVVVTEMAMGGTPRSTKRVYDKK